MDVLTTTRELLDATSLPGPLADELLAGAPPLWLSTSTPAAAASQLALCHPALRHEEVRAAVSDSDAGWRLSVVAADRRGLLADTTAVLAAQGLSIVAASVATWPDLGLALHALDVAPPAPSPVELDLLGDRLRAVGRSAWTPFRFRPAGRLVATWTGRSGEAELLTIEGPDQVGFVAGVCRWLADHDVDIVSAWVSTRRGTAHDVFGLTGSGVDRLDLDELATALSDVS